MSESTRLASGVQKMVTRPGEHLSSAIIGVSGALKGGLILMHKHCWRGTFVDFWGSLLLQVPKALFFSRTDNVLYTYT